MSVLFVWKKKTSGNKPPVSLHWVCLAFLSSGGHTSSYSLCCKHRFCSRLLQAASLVVPVFFSHPMSKGLGAQSLTVPPVWDWTSAPSHQVVWTFHTHLWHGRAFTAVLTLFTSRFFCLFSVEYNLCSCSSHPSLPSWRLTVTSWGHQVLTPAESALPKLVPVPLLGTTNPPLSPDFWDSAGLPHEFSRTLSSPVLWNPYTHPSHPAIPAKVCPMDRAIIRQLRGHEDLPGCAKQRHLCHILFTWKPANSCKQMLPAVTWMGLVCDKLHILDEFWAFLKNE